MKIISGILLRAFVGFIHFHRGSTELPPDHIFVEMRDMSVFEGPLHMSEYLDVFDGFFTIPAWMQPGEAEFSTGVYAFIRLATGEHYEGALETTNRPENYDPHPHGPVICEIRLGDNLFLKTEPFEIHVPTHVHYPELPCYPLPNHVYITMRGGPIYSAVLLAPHELAENHNRLRLEAASLDGSPPHQTPQSSHQTPQSSHQTPQSSHETPQPSHQKAQSHHQTAQSHYQTAQPHSESDQPPRKAARTQYSPHPR